MSGKESATRVLGASVRGASHVRKGKPNEDAWGMWRSDNGAVVMGAVADGHGSEKSVRSHIGAQLAVEAARQVVAGEGPRWREATIDETRALSRKIPTSLVAKWQCLVAEDLLRNPLRPHEFDGLSEEARRRVVLDPARAYGTTLLMTIVVDSIRICAAIGDGEILLVQDGQCTPAFAADERFIANETASLCLPDAVKEFRVSLVEEPANCRQGLVVLCTDGVSNAFRSTEGFYQLGSDLLLDLQERSDEEILQDLPLWLEEFSSQGSGDDVTLCMVMAGKDDESSSTSVRASGRPKTELIPLDEAETEPCTFPGASGRSQNQSIPERLLDKASWFLRFSRKSSDTKRGDS